MPEFVSDTGVAGRALHRLLDERLWWTIEGARRLEHGEGHPRPHDPLGPHQVVPRQWISGRSGPCSTSRGCAAEYDLLFERFGPRVDAGHRHRCKEGRERHRTREKYGRDRHPDRHLRDHGVAPWCVTWAGPSTRRSRRSTRSPRRSPRAPLRPSPRRSTTGSSAYRTWDPSGRSSSSTPSPRAPRVHPRRGRVITPGPTVDFVPSAGTGDPTQFPAPLARIGLLKMDYLGLRTHDHRDAWRHPSPRPRAARDGRAPPGGLRAPHGR